MKWISKNIFTIVIGVLGWTLALYLFVLSKSTRNLTYLVNPTKSIVLQYGQSSKLKVSHGEKDIESDITIAQIAVWNSGSEAIRREHLLDEVRIVASPQVDILETSIRKTNREVICFSLTDSLFLQGIIPISWKILEKNDGAVIEIIYSGTPEVNFIIEGVIQEQKKIVQFNPLMKKGTVFNNIFQIVIILIIMMVMPAVSNALRDKILKIESKFTKSKLGFVIINVLSIVVFLLIVYAVLIWFLPLLSKPAVPPFGF